MRTIGHIADTRALQHRFSPPTNGHMHGRNQVVDGPFHGWRATPKELQNLPGVGLLLAHSQLACAASAPTGHSRLIAAAVRCPLAAHENCDRLWWRRGFLVPIWGKLGAARHGERFAPDWAWCVVALDEVMLIATPVRRGWAHEGADSVRLGLSTRPSGRKIHRKLESSSSSSRARRYLGYFWPN